MNKVKVRINGEDVEVLVPAAPSILPEKEQEQWEKDFVNGYKEAAKDSSKSESDRTQLATVEANRALRVDDEEIKTLAEADKLPAWKIHKRELSKDKTKITVVTIDGKKFIFPAAKAAAPPSQPAPAKPAAAPAQ